MVVDVVVKCRRGKLEEDALRQTRVKTRDKRQASALDLDDTPRTLTIAYNPQPQTASGAGEGEIRARVANVYLYTRDET